MYYPRIDETVTFRLQCAFFARISCQNEQFD